MKRIILTQILILTSIISFSQDIKMTTESVKNKELQDLLSFENIDYFNITFSGKSLIGKDYLLISKEIWNGVITKTDTVLNSSKNNFITKIEKDSFSYKVISKKTVDNFLKMKFIFPQFGITAKYRAIDSEDYSLRDFGTGLNIKVGQNFYALAYILPYEKDGRKEWCAVENSGIDIENWGKEFGIEHYLIFEMKFE